MKYYLQQLWRLFSDRKTGSKTLFVADESDESLWGKSTVEVETVRYISWLKQTVRLKQQNVLSLGDDVIVPVFQVRRISHRG